MAHKLITLLGKARDKNGNYRLANYDLTPHGGAIIETSYFGLALDKHIQSDGLIVLGTTGSMWDNFLAQLDPQEEYADAQLALYEAASNDEIGKEHLAELSQIASKTLEKEVICDLIPYGKDEAEQISTISQILAYFNKGDRATLDVTHGLRHLPMLVEQVANLLPTLRQTEIAGIYYGALDLSRDNKTPVMRLDGLQQINHWQNTLAAYDQSGNIGVFASILEKIGINKESIRLLEQAALADQTHNLLLSQEKIRELLRRLDKEVDNKLLNFILPTLKQRLSRLNDSAWEQRFRSANNALAHKDYLRTALYGYEAISERILEHLQFESAEYKERNDAIHGYIDDLKKKELGKNTNKKIIKSFHTLRKIRNKLAHGEDNKEIAALLNNEAKLHKTLQECLQDLKDLTL